MNYQFYTNSIKSWKEMYNSISLASESIYLEMYIFTDDMKEFNFLELFKQKAQNGLRVRIILDSFGSSKLSKNAIAGLKESGVELFFISHFFHHTHRKILIIDETIAFIGGVNFHQSAYLWDDLIIKVKGKVVPYIIRSFAKAYEKCGGKDYIILQYKDNLKIISDKAHFWLVEHFPIGKKNELKYIYKNNIDNAKESIILITPYFMPRRWLIALLHQAVLRGVKVDILVPQFTDYYILDRVNYFFMFKVSKLGINLYLEKNMNHAKVMIIDKKVGLVGSHNLDYLSFDYNSELGIFFNNGGAVKKLLEISEKWGKDSILFDPKIHKPNFFDYILSPVISIFSRIL